MQEQPPVERPPLSSAALPADNGATGLGLLMQLVGSVTLCFGAFLLIQPIIMGRGGNGQVQIFLIGVLSILRSGLHRNAGKELLYGSPTGHLRGLRIYINASLVQTVLVYLLMKKSGLLSPAALYFSAILISWPLALWVCSRLAPLKNLQQEVAKPADMGFESAAVLMSILGSFGVVFGGIMTISLFKSRAFHISDAPSFMMAAIMMMLVLRSVLHARAGIAGTAGVKSERATESAALYFNFGVLTAVVTAAVIMLQMLMIRSGFHIALFVIVGLVGYLLLTWPTILRAFFTDRNFAMLLDEGIHARRAADQGLTALGWLLLLSSSNALAGALADCFLVESMADMSRRFLLVGGLTPAGSTGPWLQIPLALLGVAAAFELVRMGRYYRQLTTTYGVIAGVTNGYSAWKSLDGLGQGGPSIEAFILSPYLGVVAALILPLGALLLVNRHHIPDARARIRA